MPRDPIGPATVPGAFDDHAASYDRLVGRNPGYHEHLRLSARRLGRWSAPQAPARDGTGPRLLDLGCGTGASTAALLAAAPDAEIVAVDGSAEMIAEARRKDWPDRVRFVHSRLEDLSTTGITGPFDGILAAYLVRNLPDRDAGLRTMYDLLAPGAPIAVHEYSVRDSRRARAVWTAVSWGIIIPLGRRVTGSTDLYRYLWRSVLDFDGAGRLAARMRAAGFADVRVEPVTGWQRGIVHSFLGRRPT
ncbi:class I SAM-dependent methyltransferase [Pseudonocardia sp. RS11V-5]|uniref:class I SAM-dependent methyltransferase n=1 Tax=Pseudonocardia terrae TaxID=2905831 RepID=UPI001E3C5FAC|nr:class I SAM-dependent methyltransferase [Pseudonocardia terrae]MCE3554685.1 class I SAM-dependent methyltransferase [Pseudonocardia terrae]